MTLDEFKAEVNNQKETIIAKLPNTEQMALRALDTIEASSQTNPADIMIDVIKEMFAGMDPDAELVGKWACELLRKAVTDATA